MSVRFLDSVGCAIDDRTGIIYPVNANGTVDKESDGVLVTDLDPRWWENLSPTDQQVMEDVAEKIDRAIQMSKWE